MDEMNELKKWLKEEKDSYNVEKEKAKKDNFKTMENYYEGLELMCKYVITKIECMQILKTRQK